MAVPEQNFDPSSLSSCIDPYTMMSKPEPRSRYLGIPYPRDPSEARSIIDDLDRQLYMHRRGSSYADQGYGSPTNVNVRCVLEKEKEPVKHLPACYAPDRAKKLLLVSK